jgi:hypothetical protein
LCQRLLRDTRLYEHLLRCDRDLAREARERGCFCGGRLDSGNYPRKPQGGPPIPARLRAEDPDHSRRLSLCCASCRTRTTPPSVRFLGRRWYQAATVLLVSALRHGMTPRRVARLRELHDVSRRTLERWRTWWLETFVTTDLWLAFRGRFTPPVDEAAVPRALLERFGPLGTKHGLVGALQFVGPLGASERARRGLIVGPQKVRVDKRGGRS